MIQTLYVWHGKLSSYTIKRKKHRAFHGNLINQKAFSALSDSLQDLLANLHMSCSWHNLLILSPVSQTVPRHELGAPGSSGLCPIPELQPWESVLGPRDGDWGLCAPAKLHQGACLPASCGKVQSLCQFCSLFLCAFPPTHHMANSLRSQLTYHFLKEAFLDCPYPWSTLDPLSFFSCITLFFFIAFIIKILMYLSLSLDYYGEEGIGGF